jgi:hypothetical protein
LNNSTGNNYFRFYVGTQGESQNLVIMKKKASGYSLTTAGLTHISVVVTSHSPVQTAYAAGDKLILALVPDSGYAFPAVTGANIGNGSDVVTYLYSGTATGVTLTVTFGSADVSVAGAAIHVDHTYSNGLYEIVTTANLHCTGH